ncbi:bifunctional hydroxymethylpyrimidine kinase/phosphomethylpyrimidine kinase [Litorivicinus sp.]|jgi:hydroxymethylpyrimidine/phosphomethylpyrimidine kinase|nr:bifunctional hydroxymethylpyrimidine kinase/phosphomethylpyrimidine kinase [Litorivicinus sp.]MDB9862872.1 bifunctional hydroxymethylpyrimidine kinase/phosphomethylpyrimidine kinase [Litorivicinus sp.]MDC1208326.1 bifunctional hydroxymethylpyrimidine kinase/phosphomethylpyrimidine kinase [Litorivicinus sp.]MDC1239423.1 bifunctional hydroxymethylpyrimidine kinase/phosphomethylpyrimidine kinase [Litorivicinus sp.]MDC1319845.1 bifunctional hydroxymethylpyrimidine kinase/phosphomethylpyrimidine |tara:strand:- start:4793 stop:5596 length:804 start_codon:yes stop_codon:yes gene_type:complete
MYANILTIAGSDSGGGAGIQADLKTISATGAYGLSVITALTAQNTLGVAAIYPVAIDFLRAQMEAVACDIRIDAVKIGMLGTPDVIEAVSQFIDTLRCPVVVDPVMVAKSGDRLLHADAVAALSAQLIPKATLITPNLPEASDMLSLPEAKTRDEMMRQADLLLEMGAQAVLIKGGHLTVDESPDLLASDAGTQWFEMNRVETINTHGTGCTLSSALASYLGQGLGLEVSVSKAKIYVFEAISAANELSVGRGHGPVHHFWNLRRSN